MFSWPKLQAGAGGTGTTGYAERTLVSGRLICDTYLAAKDLIRSKNYSLTQISLSQLKIRRQEIESEQVVQLFDSADGLLKLVRHCQTDSFITASLMNKLQILPLTLQLTNLAGNLWSRTLAGARAERNEYLLLHEFHRNKTICPDPISWRRSKPEEKDDDDDDDEAPASRRRKPAYTGGLVLEPKVGLFDSFVMVLDFNSLYPSIIQEFNICFTTVAIPDTEDKMPDVPESFLDQGVLPRLIGELVERRKIVKKLLKESELNSTKASQYEIRQQALKLTANSMYGCLGFQHSRFHAKSLAMLITAKGREILQNTVEIAQKQEMEVIYGDTDSIMIYSPCDTIETVRKQGNNLRKYVNKKYKRVEIGIDGVFKKMLLLKKKKYAALKLDGEIETKGLDLVRRDWCGLSRDVSQFVLEQILTSTNKNDMLDTIHDYLKRVGEETRQGLIPISKYVINKSLAKPPQEYADGKIQPHVQVALDMQKRGLSAKTGDTIPYVICEEGASVAQKARHPAQTGKIDIEWYLRQQVYPPLSRLCIPVRGIEAPRISTSLGLSLEFIKEEEKQPEEVAEVLDVTCTKCKQKQQFTTKNFRCLACNEIFAVGMIDSFLRQEAQSALMSYGKHRNSAQLAQQLTRLDKLAKTPNYPGARIIQFTMKVYLNKSERNAVNLKQLFGPLSSRVS